MSDTITAVIAAHHARVTNGMLNRALRSVTAQTRPVDAISVAVDPGGQGASATRQRALNTACTDWVAFLDSDDAWSPHHLDTLLTYAHEHEADYVYSWFTIRDRDGNPHPEWDPFPTTFGKRFDPRNPVQTTITVLVRTELALEVGFLGDNPAPATPDGHRAGEDWAFTLGCMDRDATIIHAPRRTWDWYHHGLNTSGLPGRGDDLARHLQLNQA